MEYKNPTLEQYLPIINVCLLILSGVALTAFLVYTKTVLMLAYMNRESLEISMREGRTCFWSRSRKELWRKGETMLAALGIWYLVQILGIVPIINVAIPEEISQDIPQAKVYRSK